MFDRGWKVKMPYISPSKEEGKLHAVYLRRTIRRRFLYKPHWLSYKIYGCEEDSGSSIGNEYAYLHWKTPASPRLASPPHASNPVHSFSSRLGIIWRWKRFLDVLLRMEIIFPVC